MKYDINRIKTLYDSGMNFKYLFFWGHTPGKGQMVGDFCFSQWFHSPFMVDNKIYQTAEHWMMAEKARLFNDVEIECQILNVNEPAQAKDLGRKIKGYSEDIWVEKRFEIVVQGNIHKFTQHPELKEFLLNTKDRLIVEASPVDTIWGNGLSKDSKDIENPHKWRGFNLLGFALMEVRERINKLENSLYYNDQDETITLFRPVGPKELALIEESGWQVFPPRLPEQPIFYPVLNEAYAKQIATEWNVKASGSGFVTKFTIDKLFFLKFESHNVGGEIHDELWVPAEHLDDFNKHIIGKIQVIDKFFASKQID